MKKSLIITSFILLSLISFSKGVNIVSQANDTSKIIIEINQNSIMYFDVISNSGEKSPYNPNEYPSLLKEGDRIEVPMDNLAIHSYKFSFIPRFETITPIKPLEFTIERSGKGIINKTVEFKGDSVSDIIEYLESGANINYISPNDDNQYTMLHKAVRQDNYEVAKYLVEKGAAINKQSADGETAIFFCKSNEMFNLLLDNNANLKLLSIDKTSVLHSYAIIGLLDPIKRIVYDGLVDINLKDRSGGTALLYAVQFDQYETVEYLLKSGAKQYFGWQVYPIHYACEKGNLEMVKLLVEYGADLNSKTGSGKTTLYYAQLSYNQELIDFLIEKGIK